MKQFPIQKLKELVDNSKSILLFLPQKLIYDQLAAALALFLSLQEQSDKIVSIHSLGKLIVDFSHLVGLDQIKPQFNHQNLVISIAASPDSTDKILYQPQTDHLDLIIQPKSGSPAPQPHQVSFSQTNDQADLVFLFGIQEFSDLGKIYSDYPSLFNSHKIVTLGNISPSFAPLYDLTDNSNSSAVETTTQFMQQLNLPVNPDIANNLMLGLQRATDNFQSDLANSDSFYTASVLLQAGAQRSPIVSDSSPSVPHPSSESTPIEFVERSPAISRETPDDQVPSDWLKPKIFKP